MLYCREDDEVVQSRVFRCFFKLFFDHYKRIFRHHCLPGSTLYSVDDQLQQSFDSGICKFYLVIRKDGWQERGASVQTALFTFCYYQLRALLSYMRRHPGEAGWNPYEDLEKANIFDVPAESEFGDEEVALFEKGFALLEPKCQDFIRRKLRRMTEEELKAKYPDLDFTSRDPYDITFRCVKKLKKIIDELRRGK